MDILETNKIVKSELEKLKEDDLIFITNPGRMGDEDEITFIIKRENELTVYEVDGILYRKKNKKTDISLDDVLKQFPKWHDTWKNSNDKGYKGKYKYLYMGFGNGLSVDNCIYSEFKNYLNELVEDYLKNNNNSEKESLKYAAIYNVWENALISYSKEKGFFLK